jgi:hypothetical protein
MKKTLTENPETQCFICGNPECQEEPDHKKITYPEFDSLLKSKVGYQPEIDKIKSNIRKCYTKIEKHSHEPMDNYITELYLAVDKLYFWHLLRF